METNTENSKGFNKTCRKCGCCYSAETWPALHYVGEMTMMSTSLELCNCPCGNTLATNITEKSHA